MGSHLPDSQSESSVDYQPHYVRLGELDRLFFVGNLVAVLRVSTEFKTGDQTLLLREVRGYIRHHNVKNAQAAIDCAMASAPSLGAFQLI